MKLKEEYEKLKRKYGLPSYDELDKEFEFFYFGELVEVSQPSRFFRRRVNDRLNIFVSILQDLLQPNPSSLVSLEEANFVDEETKNKVSLVIKELMSLVRRSLLLDVKFDEAKDAEFINNAYKTWTDIRDDVFSILNKVKDGWEEKVKEKRSEHYFG